MLPRKLLATLPLLALSFACSDLPSPRIDAIVPAEGQSGDQVHLLGAGFSGEAVSVAFAGQPARLLSHASRRVIVEVPKGLSGLTLVVVTVDGHPSAPADFWVGDAPLPDGGR